MRKCTIKKMMLVIAAVLLLTLQIVPCAYGMDLTKQGSITFHMTEDYDPVSGGDIHLVRIASLELIDGYRRYVWLPEFEGIGLNAEDCGTYEFAETVYHWCNSHNIESIGKNIDSNGVARFDNLPLGLYLYFQTRPAPGYSLLCPFTVTLPIREGITDTYDIDISPKPVVIPTEPTEPTETTSQTEPANPSEPTAPSQHNKTKLPKTGQLQWPIPVLAAVGIFMLLFGLLLRRAEEQNE